MISKMFSGGDGVVFKWFSKVSCSFLVVLNGFQLVF